MFQYDIHHITATGYVERSELKLSGSKQSLARSENLDC